MCPCGSRGIPAGRIHHRNGVSRVILHTPVTLRQVGATDAARPVCQDFEPLGQFRLEKLAFHAEVVIRAAKVQSAPLCRVRTGRAGMDGHPRQPHAKSQEQDIDVDET